MPVGCLYNSAYGVSRRMYSGHYRDHNQNEVGWVTSRMYQVPFFSGMIHGGLWFPWSYYTGVRYPGTFLFYGGP